MRTAQEVKDRLMNGFYNKYNKQKLKKIGQKMKQEARNEELNKD
jgi:hypothetical protein